MTEDNGSLRLSPADEQRLWEHVQYAVESQEELQQSVLGCVAKAYKQSWERSSSREMPQFAVGDYLLVPRVYQQEHHPKIVSTWTEPWRVVSEDKEYVYTVQSIMNGVLRDAHVARMRFNAGQALAATKPMK